jgi:hypothetical protein
MATMDFTTKPLMPDCCEPIAYCHIWTLGPALPLLLQCTIFRFFACVKAAPFSIGQACLTGVVQAGFRPSSARLMVWDVLFWPLHKLCSGKPRSQNRGLHERKMAQLYQGLGARFLPTNRQLALQLSPDSQPNAALPPEVCVPTNYDSVRYIPANLSGMALIRSSMTLSP